MECGKVKAYYSGLIEMRLASNPDKGLVRVAN